MAVFAGLLLSLLQLARVTAAAMRISPRISFIAVPFETSSYAFTNVSAGQTVHRPPLKRRVVTTNSGSPGAFYFNIGGDSVVVADELYGYPALRTDRYSPFTLTDVPDYPARHGS
jgi:hypothetical protein